MIKNIFSLLSKGKLTVLVFHKVPIEFENLEASESKLEVFEKTLFSIRNYFNILPLEEALRYLKKGNLPERSACLTFDDGYLNWMNGVVPVLEKSNSHATFFITTGQFDGLSLWNERVLNSVKNSKTLNLDFKNFGLPSFCLNSSKRKENCIVQIKAFLKYLSISEREIFLNELEFQTKTSNKDTNYLSRSDIRYLHSKGFGIGAHSVAHPILTSCHSDFSYREIAESREELVSIIKAPVNSFAYPNGIPGKDFNFEHSMMLEKSGYQYGFTTHHGYVSKNSSFWQIPRFTPWGNTDIRRKVQFALNFAEKPVTLTSDSSKNQKILMIAFHFPPQAGSSGVQRTLNFVKYLPSYGWTPTVLSAHPRAYLQRSNDLLDSIPSQTSVVRSFALDAAVNFSIKKKYPGILAVPDRWSSWWLSGVYHGWKIIKNEKPSLIWSTYPIATAHLIAATLHRLTGLPWIADFRDPMISGKNPSQMLQRKAVQWIEKFAIRNANQCVFTTEKTAQKYIANYPEFSYKFVVIENGYDEDIFSRKLYENSENGEHVLFLHSGVIYPEDRDPSHFLKALKNLNLANEGAVKKIKVRFRASQNEIALAQLVESLGMQSMVEILPSISYADAIEEMHRADLLLVFQGKNFNDQIPAKIYEYIRTGRSILALVDPAGDTARKLSEFKAPIIANIDSSKDIESALTGWFAEKNSLKNSAAIGSDLEKIKNFSRKKQTSLLGHIFTYSAAG